MRQWGLRKRSKFGVIRCTTERVIGRKPHSGNFRQTNPAAGAKTVGQIPKNQGVQKWNRRTFSMRTQSLVEVGGRTAAADKQEVIMEMRYPNVT